MTFWKRFIYHVWSGVDKVIARLYRHMPWSKAFKEFPLLRIFEKKQRDSNTCDTNALMETLE